VNVNDDYDDLFDAWGKALNVNPQLGKTVFHLESNGNPNSPDGPVSPYSTVPGERAQGGMQIEPSTAVGLAKQLGFDPKSVNLRDMRWAVPLAMQMLANGLNATDTAEGAMAYYFAGPDQRKWGRQTGDYVQRGIGLWPQMALTPAKPPAPGGAPANAGSPQPQTAQGQQ
jgi:soluble lytic murein transglycosylase-like protein